MTIVFFFSYTVTPHLGRGLNSGRPDGARAELWRMSPAPALLLPVASLVSLSLFGRCFGKLAFL